MDKVIKNENRDHIYCNVKTRKDLAYADTEKTTFIGDDRTVKKMKNFILSNINLIEELQNQLAERDSLIAKLLAENDGLKQRLQRYKHSKSSSKKSELFKSDANHTNNSIAGNNTAPANKNKTSEKKNAENALKDKRVSIDTSDDEIFNKKPSDDSQESISIKLSSKNLFLMTNKPYIINDWKICDLEDEEIQKGFDDINLEVPNWVEVDLPASDEIENLPIEDVSDEAFLKRHQKYEVDERRRKKWDQQRIREQKNIERLRKRHLKEEYPEITTVAAKVPKVMTSFFPDIETIKFIQISDDLPISAFGEQIPKLLPKDFSLPWQESSDNDDNSNIYSIEQICSNGNPRMKVRTKFISRCMQPMSK